jgi:hypothetical protein
VSVRLAGIPQVDDLAFHADGWLLAPVGGDDLPVQDHVGKTLIPGSLQRLAQLWGLFGQDDDDLVQVLVGGGPRDAMAAGECIVWGSNTRPRFDLAFYAARSYSRMRPPRTSRRLIRFWERSAAG